jgi:hypothetical protein
VSAEPVVRAGYRGRSRPTHEELVLRLEAARSETQVACSRYTRLRGAVLDWLEARGLENESQYLIRMEREAGRRR